MYLYIALSAITVIQEEFHAGIYSLEHKLGGGCTASVLMCGEVASLGWKFWSLTQQ